MHKTKGRARCRNLRLGDARAVVRRHQVAPHVRHRARAVARPVRRGVCHHRGGTVVDERTLPVFHRHRKGARRLVARSVFHREAHRRRPQLELLAAHRTVVLRQAVIRAVVPKVREGVTHRSVALAHIRRHRRVRRAGDRRGNRVANRHRERTLRRVAGVVRHDIAFGVHTAVLIKVRARAKTARKRRHSARAIVGANRRCVAHRHATGAARRNIGIGFRLTAVAAVEAAVRFDRDIARAVNLGALFVPNCHREIAHRRTVARRIEVPPLHHRRTYVKKVARSAALDQGTRLVGAAAVVVETRCGVPYVRPALTRVVVYRAV
ncbi:MAG: hypothetical protein PGMFKBFP_01599 [Anaerolineales bacterium]|nr:hypothetical protein [Anaerolineales bacterium]